MTEKGLVLGKYPLNASLFLPPCAILIKKKKKKQKTKKTKMTYVGKQRNMDGSTEINKSDRDNKQLNS